MSVIRKEEIQQLFCGRKSRSDRKMDLLFAWHIWHKCKTWMENERN